KPGRTWGIGCRPVVNAQHTADNVLIDLHTESQRNLLRNAGTTPAGITPFRCHDGLDEVLVGSLRARPTAVPGRKQHAVLSLAQPTVEMQQSGRLQNDGGTNDTCRAQEQGAQAGDDPIRGTQVKRTLAPAIEDEQLMPDQQGFGANGTESTGPRQSGQGDDQMNEYDSEVAHAGNGINTSKTTALRPIWQFAIDRLRHLLQPPEHGRQELRVCPVLLDYPHDGRVHHETPQARHAAPPPALAAGAMVGIML